MRFMVMLTPKRVVPKRGAPDLMEQTRLSLAQIESKKTDPNLPKKPGRKVPTGREKDTAKGTRLSLGHCP